MEAVRAHPARRRVEARADPPAGDPPARPAALERIAAADRRLAWDACLNVRDLGGLPAANGTISRGVLVRASMLGGALTPAALAAVRDHGIRTVIDIRSGDELAEAPSPYRADLEYRNIPFVHGRTMGLHRAAHAGELESELGRLALPDSGLAEIVAAIAGAEPGIVLHCVAGRDRTGIIVALLLAAFGVPDDEIVADYVASDAELTAATNTYVAAHPEDATDIAEAIERRSWVMEQVLGTLRDRFGGAAAYLRLAGVSDEQLGAIRAKLLA